MLLGLGSFLYGVASAVAGAGGVILWSALNGGA